MKIKEVIKKTELTDKAIRLYIDNGLVAPSIDESYSGRKSIDFSDDDVERLSNIALLRKAGFSIADIKDIIESDEKAKCVVERFIEETENNIQHETEIIEKLKNIPEENGISMKTICESLSKTVERKQMPKEDMRLSAPERTIRGLFCGLGGLGIFLSIGGFIVYEIVLNNEFKYATFSSLFVPVAICSGFVIMLVMAFFLIRINVGRYFLSAKKTVRYIYSIIIPFVYIPFSVIVFLSSFTSLFAAYSETDNYKNYLKLDWWAEDVYSDEIYDIFPEEIPESADEKSIKYFYRGESTLYDSFEIIAEWELPKDEYEKAKNIKLPDRYYTYNTDNWRIIYYSDDSTNDLIDFYNFQNYEINILNDEGLWLQSAEFLGVFAYNDKEQMVRYICTSNIMDAKYITLDW